MAKFQKSTSKELQAISTASLPDIVFMLIFFFMVSTTMREVDYMVEFTLPNASEIKKLENKELVSYIYIGKPIKKFQDIYGTQSRIQLNDAFKSVDDILDFIVIERDKLAEHEQKKMTVSLKVDTETKMGIVSDVKLALRRASALKINYSSRQATTSTSQ